MRRGTRGGQRSALSYKGFGRRKVGAWLAVPNVREVLGWGLVGSSTGGARARGEVCESCQCSHMSNTPMHDVYMLKVLVWTQ